MRRLYKWLGLLLSVLIAFSAGFESANITTSKSNGSGTVLWHDNNAVLRWGKSDIKGSGTVTLSSASAYFLGEGGAYVEVITGLNNTAVEGAYHIIPFVSEKIIIEEYQFSVADIADVSMINLFDTDIYNGTENYSYAVYWDNATKEIFYNTGNYNTGSGHWQDSGFSYNIVSTVPYRVELLYDTSTNKYVGLWIDNTYFNFSNFTVGYIDSTISPRIQIRPSITHGNTAKYAELEFWDYTISAG